jgi:hypothetical protein
MSFNKWQKLIAISTAKVVPWISLLEIAVVEVASLMRLLERGGILVEIAAEARRIAVVRLPHDESAWRLGS